eukprot:SAG11_NODE_7560_length_1129_cov_1.257282_1_plen_63_part_00
MLTILANAIPHSYSLIAYFYIYTQPLRNPHALSLYLTRLDELCIRVSCIWLLLTVVSVCARG